MQNDLEKELNDKIKELVTLSKKLQRPLFIASANEKNNKTEYTTEIVSPFYLNQSLTNDVYPELLLVMNGFHVSKTQKENLTLQELFKS